ncbi:MAG: ATP-grasp domain-containing protein [Elusimicrobia bacterium]|nr:ATP-grasp domain-containing protein [Elusimicrobiota bacterium]
MSDRYAVVTDGLWRKSLSAIRALGKNGFHVEVLGDSLFTTGFWSRFTDRRTLSVTAEKNSNLFGKKLLDVLHSYSSKRIPVLFPMEDDSLRWVVENEGKLRGLCHTLVPSPDAFNIAADKERTLQRARELGLPVPETFSPNNSDDLICLLRDQQRNFPEKRFIVKPTHGRGSSGLVHDAQLSRMDWGAHWARHGRLVIQEKVPVEGRGVGVSVLIDMSGQCSAWFIHERLREYPVSGGPSTDRRSIHWPALLDWSLQLLRSIQWQGVAMVEWKIHPATGIPLLMEINPRFWGSLELAVRAGVNFPVLYADAAEGLPSTAPPGYPDGVRVRWMIPGDILRFLTEEPTPQRETLMEFFSGLPGLSEEWDPMDIRGSIACVICPVVSALNPKYWKFIFR